MRSKQSFNNGRDGGRTSRGRSRGTPMAEREESSSRRRGRGSPMAEHQEPARQERREEENSEATNVCEHCVALFQNNRILPSPSFQVLSGLPTPIYNHQGLNIQVFPPPRNNPQGFNSQVPSSSNLPPPRNNSQSFNIQVRSNLPPPMNNSQGFNIQVLSNLPPPTNNPHGYNGNRPSYR